MICVAAYLGLHEVKGEDEALVETGQAATLSYDELNLLLTSCTQRFAGKVEEGNVECKSSSGATKN